MARTGASVKVEYVGRAPLAGSDDRKLMATLREGTPARTAGPGRLGTAFAPAYFDAPPHDARRRGPFLPDARTVWGGAAESRQARRERCNALAGATGGDVHLRQRSRAGFGLRARAACAGPCSCGRGLY